MYDYSIFNVHFLDVLAGVLRWGASGRRGGMVVQEVSIALSYVLVHCGPINSRRLVLKTRGGVPVMERCCSTECMVGKWIDRHAHQWTVEELNKKSVTHSSQ